MMSEQDDRDLIECFNLIYELYPTPRPPDAAPSLDDLPSLAESRDALRLYAQIDDPELRTAIRMLLRTLTSSAKSADPSGPLPSAANKPN